MKLKTLRQLRTKFVRSAARLLGKPSGPMTITQCDEILAGKLGSTRTTISKVRHGAKNCSVTRATKLRELLGPKATFLNPDIMLRQPSGERKRTNELISSASESKSKDSATTLKAPASVAKDQRRFDSGGQSQMKFDTHKEVKGSKVVFSLRCTGGTLSGFNLRKGTFTVTFEQSLNGG